MALLTVQIYPRDDAITEHLPKTWHFSPTTEQVGGVNAAVSEMVAHAQQLATDGQPASFDLYAGDVAITLTTLSSMLLHVHNNPEEKVTRLFRGSNDDERLVMLHLGVKVSGQLMLDNSWFTYLGGLVLAALTYQRASPAPPVTTQPG
mgnify:CR=1 FL=1